MKRCAAVLGIVAALVWLQGCWVYSAFPLAATEGDLLFDRNLLGTWAQDDGCVLTIARLDQEQSYRVSYAVPREGKTEECLLKPGQSAGFVGAVVEINGVRFLDLYPADPEPMHHTMELHSVYKMVLNGRTLTFLPMHEAWIKQQVASGTVSLTVRQHFGKEDDDLILTSSTRELRNFLAANGGNDQLFPSEHKIVFQRKLEPGGTTVRPASEVRPDSDRPVP